MEKDIVHYLYSDRKGKLGIAEAMPQGSLLMAASTCKEALEDAQELGDNRDGVWFVPGVTKEDEQEGKNLTIIDFKIKLHNLIKGVELK